MAQVTDRFVEYATDVMVLGKAANGGTIVSLVTDRRAMREVRESHVRVGRTDQLDAAREQLLSREGDAR